jgi:hypothetical protein
VPKAAEPHVSASEVQQTCRGGALPLTPRNVRPTPATTFRFPQRLLAGSISRGRKPAIASPWAPLPAVAPFSTQ